MRMKYDRDLLWLLWKVILWIEKTSIPKKRQINTSLQFYKHLNLNNEVECFLEDGTIIVRPLNRVTTEFSVEVLRDLI